RTCTLAVETLTDYHAWQPSIIGRLRLFVEVLAGGLYRRRKAVALRRTRSELARVTKTLEREQEPEAAPPPRAEFEGIIGASAALQGVLARVQEVSPTDSTVLLLGETGTGKELIARAIHARGPRRAKPLVTVNCAALPPTLIESELFGHVRGAFTGAV